VRDSKAHKVQAQARSRSQALQVGDMERLKNFLRKIRPRAFSNKKTGKNFEDSIIFMLDKYK
jgi:hypothetical protein